MSYRWQRSCWKNNFFWKYLQGNTENTIEWQHKIRILQESVEHDNSRTQLKFPDYSRFVATLYIWKRMISQKRLHKMGTNCEHYIVNWCCPDLARLDCTNSPPFLAFFFINIFMDYKQPQLATSFDILTSATCGSTIFITICACRSAYASWGFWSSMLRASFGLFWMHSWQKI